MASILDLLSTEIGDELVQKTSRKTSESKENVTSALSMAMPLLLAAMRKNAQSEEGARNLDKALSSQKHNGDLLHQLNTVNTSELEQEGGKILAHVLGGKQNGIENTLGASLNMNKETIGEILKIAAPILLSVLGSQKRKDQVSEGGLSDLIGSVLGGSAKNDQSLLETILDSDGDGSIIDDIGGMILGGGKKKSGGLLGGMLGGK